MNLIGQLEQSSLLSISSVTALALSIYVLITDLRRQTQFLNDEQSQMFGFVICFGIILFGSTLGGATGRLMMDGCVGGVVK